jgi:hypothetical protein
VTGVQSCALPISTVKIGLPFLHLPDHLSGSCRMEPGRTQQMLFWTFCRTLSTSVSSQTDFLHISHVVGQNWPPNNPDLNPCDYFLWGFLKEKIFPKKPQTAIELRALIIQSCNKITVDLC